MFRSVSDISASQPFLPEISAWLGKRNAAVGETIWSEYEDGRLVITGYRLDRVLQAVEDELGPTAKLVETERFVSGGIRGFFGRECFRVVAEEQRESAPASSEADSGVLEGPTFAKSLADALARLDAVEESRLTTIAEIDLSELLGMEPCDEMSSATLPKTGTVVVVGSSEAVLRSARELSAEHGLNPDEVLVMSSTCVEGTPAWMCLSSVADARRRAERWAGDGRIRIVAIVESSDGDSWVDDAIEALSPVQVRHNDTNRPTPASAFDRSEQQIATVGMPATPKLEAVR